MRKSFKPCIENKVKFFGEQPNPQFTTPEMDPLLSKFKKVHSPGTNDGRTDNKRRFVIVGYEISVKIFSIEKRSLGGV